MHQIACHECDTLVNIPLKVEDNFIVRCPICHHKITSGHKSPVDTTIALSITSLVLLTISLFTEFMSFKASGRFRGIEVWDIANQLLKSDYYLVAGCFIICVIALPILYILLVLMLTLPQRLTRLEYKTPPIWIGKLIHHIKPWLMVEVFITGVLVALIKVISLVDLSFGASFWSFLAFTLSFTYIVYITDTHRIWDWIYAKSN